MLEKQKTLIQDLNSKLDQSDYYYFSSCLCGAPPIQDQVLFPEDRYGVKNPQVICPHCGLIRCQLFMTDSYSNHFYQNIYRNLYTAPHFQIDTFFKDQQQRGRKIVEFFKKNKISLKNKKILEIGCGSGGILQAFKDEEADVTGCDWNEEYLNFGLNQNLKLIKGDINTAHLLDKKFDLIILCHVLEHFSHPQNELEKIIQKLNDGGLIYIELPGIFKSYKYYYNPISYFQSAHCYNFTKKKLNSFCSLLKLTPLYINEEIQGLFQVSPLVKPLAFSNEALLITLFWRLQKLIWFFRINPYYWQAILKRYFKWRKK